MSSLTSHQRGSAPRVRGPGKGQRPHYLQQLVGKVQAATSQRIWPAAAPLNRDDEMELSFSPVVLLFGWEWTP